MKPVRIMEPRDRHKHAPDDDSARPAEEQLAEDVILGVDTHKDVHVAAVITLLDAGPQDLITASGGACASSSTATTPSTAVLPAPDWRPPHHDDITYSRFVPTESVRARP
jgi:hypothetical protein